MGTEELSRTMWDLLERLPDQFITLHGALFDMWLSQDCSPRAVAPKGYCLTLSLQAHRDSDPVAAVLYDALQGKLHVHVVQRMASIVQGMAALFNQMMSLHMPDADMPGYFACEDVTILLQRMFPGMTDTIWPLLEAQLGSLTAGQFIHIQDVAVAGLDCTASQWGHQRRESTAKAVGLEEPLESPQSTELGHEAVSGQIRDTAAINDGCMAKLGDHEADGLIGPQAGGNHEESRSDRDRIDQYSVSTEAGTGPDPASSGVFNASTTDQGGRCTSQAMRTKLASHLLSRHANSLLCLQESLAAELDGFEDSSGDGSAIYAAVLAHLEQRMPHVEAHASASLWLAAYMRAGSAGAATAEMLARGPLQCQGDYDIASARVWLQGLQERGAGHSSCAALPQVA